MTLMSENVATAMIEIGEAAENLDAGIAALAVTVEALGPDSSVPETKALSFVVERLGTKVQKIQAAVESVRYRQPVTTNTNA